MDKNFLTDFLRKNGKRLKSDLISFFIFGVLLIVLGNSLFSEEINNEAVVETIAQPTESPQLNDYEALEERMAEIFSSMEGVGEVRVMITLKTGNEIVIAEEEKIRDGESETSTEKSVVVLAQNDGSESPLVVKENYPLIEGIVIVAQGGDQIIVKEALSKGAQALLNVPAHKVEIFKMEN